MTVVICLLTLFSQPSGKVLPAPPTLSATTGGMKAEVRDAAGAPIAGVEIRIKHRDGRIWGALTDAKGRFAAGGLPPGDYQLTCHREGMEGETRAIQIRANAWLLGVAGEPRDLRPSKGRKVRFFGPNRYESPAYLLKSPSGSGVETIPMH